MLIRRNTKEYKGVRNILEMYADRSSRKNLIKLFVVKPGETLRERIPVDKLGAEADVYYDMNYSAILNNLYDPDHRLHKSKTVPGMYYFKSLPFPRWEQTPFQLPERLIARLDEFADLKVPKAHPHRVKGDRPEDVPAFEGGAPRTAQGKAKEKAKLKKDSKDKKKEPAEAVYGEKHRIQFSNPDEVVFDEGQITMREVLDYYSSISSTLLRYVQDRPQSFFIDGKRDVVVRSIERLQNHIQLKLPSWVKKIKTHADADDSKKHYFVCRDKDHLFYLLKMGSLELHPWLVRTRAASSPDYFVITLRPYGSFNDAIEVAQAAKAALEGGFESYIMLSEHGGFHIFVPWEERVSFDLNARIAAFTAKQIQSRAEKISALDAQEAEKHRRVFIDVSVNGETRGSVIAPYSLIHESEAGLVAAPLKWSEVKKGLDASDFTIRTMSARMKKAGDLFEGLIVGLPEE